MALLRALRCQCVLQYILLCIRILMPVLFNFRLVELLRSKLNKSNEDLDTIESIETAIEKVQKNLHNLQSEVPAFYVWGENPDTTEALLKVSVLLIKGQFYLPQILTFFPITCPI